MRAAWDVDTLQWSVFLEELDSSGDQVLKIDDMIGTPDEIVHINIKINNGAYAKIVQTGESQAYYADSNRILTCSFR